MTATSKFFVFVTFPLTALLGCSSTGKNSETFYTIKTNFSSQNTEDCSLTILTKAHKKAKVLSESKAIQCGLSVKIQNIEDNTFRMSVKVNHHHDSKSNKFKSTVVGKIGMPFVLEPFEGEKLSYTFLIEETNSL